MLGTWMVIIGVKLLESAARLWVDAVIDPLETRRVVSEGTSAANHAPIERAYNVGFIQV